MSELQLHAFILENVIKLQLIKITILITQTLWTTRSSLQNMIDRHKNT